MNTGYRGRIVWSALCLSLAIAGCGKRHHTVKGRFVFPDGTPVTGLSEREAQFILVDGHFSGISAIDADGQFEMRTIHPGDGIPSGTYRVCITPPVPDPVIASEGGRKLEPTKPPPVDPIDSKYWSPDTSGLEVTIDGKVTNLELTVEPRPVGKGKKK